MILARTLGAEGKGTITLIITLPQLIAGIGSWGLQASAVYFAGRGFNRRKLSRDILFGGVGLSLVYVAVCYAFRERILHTLLVGLESRWFDVSIWLIPFTLLFLFVTLLFQGMLKFGASTVMNLISVAFRVILLFVVLVLLDLGLASAAWTYALATVFPLIVGLVYLFFTLSRRQTDAPSARVQDLWKYGFQVHWGNIAQQANLRFDMLILNPLVSTAAVGLYSVAVPLAQLILLIPGALSQALFPRVANTSHEQGAQTTTQMTRVALYISMLGAVGLAVAGKPVLSVFGSEFTAAYGAMLALIPGLLFLSVAMIVAQFLAGIGKPQYNSIASVIALAVNLVLLFVLIPRWGIVGASVASSVAYATQCLFICFYFFNIAKVPARSILVPQHGDFAQIKRALSFGRGRTSNV